MGQYRKVKGGSLAAPVRGLPPPVPEGYVRDANDPYIFHLGLEDCKYRDTRQNIFESCTGEILYCTKLQKKVTRIICKRCTQCVSE